MSSIELLVLHLVGLGFAKVGLDCGRLSPLRFVSVLVELRFPASLPAGEMAWD